MKKLSVALLITLTACSGRGDRVPPSEVSRPTEILQDDKLVPVLCDESVALDRVDSDLLTATQALEEKVYILVRSDAQHRKNMASLSASALKCGVRISTKK